MTALKVMGEVRDLPRRIRKIEQLDRVAEPVTRFVNQALDASGLREVLSGKEWLGHPLHPALTDLPIGFWTSAFVLDLLGGQKSKRAATLMVASGIATAVPTAMSGSHDFTALNARDKRVGLIHAAANIVALLFYVRSLFARLGGRRGRGVYLGVLGATAATLGGYLGGHLVYGEDKDDVGAAQDAGNVGHAAPINGSASANAVTAPN